MGLECSSAIGAIKTRAKDMGNRGYAGCQPHHRLEVRCLIGSSNNDWL